MTTRALASIMFLLGCGGSPSSSSPDASASDDAAPDSGGSDAAVQPPARLSVSGTQILDPDGNPIVLRGYNWGQWGTALPSDGSDNAAQGANVVRIPLRWWGEWKPGVDSRDHAAPGHIEPGHLAQLDQTIQWATDAGLWVVLFIDSNYGQGADERLDNFWTNAAMKQEFIEVWQFIAERYRNAPRIAALEILPEPKPPGFADQDVRLFYDSIIPYVRAIDAHTPIIVGPNDGYSIAHLDAAYTTVDPQIIYTGNYFIFDHPVARIPELEAFLSTRNAPVWINQIGIQSGDEDAADKATRVFTALREISVGWTWWTYRAQTTRREEHGIYYRNLDDTEWLVKQEWLDLVGDALR